MIAQRQYFQILTFVGLLIAVYGLTIPEAGQNTTAETVSKETGVKNAIVLIGLNEIAKDLTGYGVIPVSEKDIVNLFDANSTLADKLVADSRNFHWRTRDATASTDDTLSHSRLLNLISTPNKALLLFALQDTLLKSSNTMVTSNCVFLSKQDLMNLMEGEGTSSRKIVHFQAHKEDDEQESHDDKNKSKN